MQFFFLLHILLQSVGKCSPQFFGTLAFCTYYRLHSFLLFFLFLPFWHPHVVDVPLIKIGNWNIDMIGLYICCCYSCRCCNCSFSICQILENIYIPLICGTLGLLSCVFSNDITLIELNKFRNLLFSKQLWAQKLVKIGLDRKSTLRPIWNVFLNK